MRILETREIQAVSGSASNPIQTLGAVLLSPVTALFLQWQLNTYGYGPNVSYFDALAIALKPRA